MKTAHLTGPALDWAVDRAYENKVPAHQHLRSYLLSLDEGELWDTLCKYTPGGVYADTMSTADMIEYGLITWRWPPATTDWAIGGPIIEREGLLVRPSFTDERDKWTSIQWAPKGVCESGPTPLVAAMRCYVASKMGDTVDIPEELT
jgi:hypothetical protein